MPLTASLVPGLIAVTLALPLKLAALVHGAGASQPKQSRVATHYDKELRVRTLPARAFLAPARLRCLPAGSLH